MIANINLIPLLPEIFIACMACAILLVDLFATKNRLQFVYYLTQAALVGAAGITIYNYSMPQTFTMQHMFIHDQIASLLKIFIYITSFIAFLYARDYVRARHIMQGEYYMLGLISVLGMMVLVSANNFIVLYLGLELLSLPLYAMIALKRDSQMGAEAAMKYFVTGAVASGMLLYGLSMLYGATGTLDIMQITTAVTAIADNNKIILVLGLVFLLAGIAFKFGAAPFHMWAPDVYDGAPTPVTLFLGSAPKVAALGLAIRLLVDAMPLYLMQWQQILIVMAILSITIGNVVAIVQNNIKRLLAYSSIAHIGYMLLGLLAGSKEGYASATFYMLNYALMAAAAFAIIVMMSRQGFEATDVNDYRGLNNRSPWLAFMMLIVMFSMAGIPPTVGFFAKVGVLEALVSSHLVWLAAFAIAMAVIGSYYYLRIVKLMYFDEPIDTAPIVSSPDMRMVISINALALLILGLFPTGLINLCRNAFF
jgi:NADH-quinone oxidoreductase subunit N